MSAETQALTLFNELLTTLNNIGFAGIVAITGLIAAITVLLWVYFGRNRGKGAEALQQSVATVTNVMANELKEKVREQSEIMENVALIAADSAKLTAGAMDMLALIRPESADTNTRVQGIQADVTQIHTDLSVKDDSVEALLARIAETTERNNGLLTALNKSVCETHDQLQRLATDRDLRPDLAELQEAITALTAVIADVKDVQAKLINSADHLYKRATGEHVAVVAKEEAA